MDRRSAQLSKAGTCEEIRSLPSGWFSCQGLFPNLLEVSQHHQEPLAQLIKERESTCVCTRGHERWNISSQARKREGDEADPWGKGKETCELSQKTRSYPGLGESWT